MDPMHLWEVAESCVQWACVVARAGLYRSIESSLVIASSGSENSLMDAPISFSPILPTIFSSTGSFYVPTTPLWTVSMMPGTSS